MESAVNANSFNSNRDLGLFLRQFTFKCSVKCYRSAVLGVADPSSGAEVATVGTGYLNALYCVV